MKSTVIAALVAITCSPVLASAPTAPLSAAPVEASPVTPASPATTANPVTTATPSAPVRINPEFFTETFPIQSANQHPSFCGQDMVYRLLAKTEFNEQLQLRLQQLRLQEELRRATAQVVAEGRIPVPQPEQPAAINPQPAQPTPQAPAETITPGPTSPQE